MTVNQKTLDTYYNSLSDDKIIKLYKEYDDLSEIAQSTLLSEITNRNLTERIREKLDNSLSADNKVSDKQNIKNSDSQLIKNFTKFPLLAILRIRILLAFKKLSVKVKGKVFNFITADDQKAQLQYFFARVIFIIAILIFGLCICLSFLIILGDSGSKSEGAAYAFLFILIMIPVSIFPIISSLIYFSNKPLGSSLFEIQSFIYLLGLLLLSSWGGGISFVGNWLIILNIITFLIYSGPIKNFFYKILTHFLS